MNTTYFDTAEGGVTAGVTAGVKTCLCDDVFIFFLAGWNSIFLMEVLPCQQLTILHQW